MKYHKAEKDTDIANNVIARQLETGYRVGILKTQALLAKKGIAVGHNRLARIMNENSLNPKFNRKRYPPEYYAQKNASQKNQERENVLNQQFDAKCPGEKLVTDITYIKVAEGWLYLSAVIDLFNMERKIKDYIEYYRTKRVQARLAYRTPHEVMLDYQAALN